MVAMTMNAVSSIANGNPVIAALDESRCNSRRAPGNRNVEIEKLRAVAIIFVILWHYKAVTLDVWGVPDDLYQLGSGVDLFFAISGYVICAGLLRSAEAGNVRTYLKRFYIKRVFRITPAAVFWVAVCGIIASISVFAVGDRIYTDTTKDVLPALLSYANVAYYFKTANHGSAMLGIYWSLSLEEQFYLIIPLLIWIFRKRINMLAYGLTAWAIIQFSMYRPPWGTLWWSVRTDGLIYGVLIAMLTARNRERRSLVPSWVKSAWALALIRSFLILILATLGSEFVTKYTQCATGLIGVVGGALVLLAVSDGGYERLGRRDRILLWIGSRSYALYLVHNVVLVIYKGIVPAGMSKGLSLLTPRYYIVVGVMAGLVAGLAELSYRFIEVPLRDRGRKIADAVV